MADTTVDARNLQCPMPVLKISKAMKDLETGQTVELIATDKGALSDMGHSLKEQFSDGDEIHFVVEKN